MLREVMKTKAEIHMATKRGARAKVSIGILLWVKGVRLVLEINLLMILRENSLMAYLRGSKNHMLMIYSTNLIREMIA